LTGCNVSVENESTATAAPLMVTATLAPTSTVRPSETLPPPPPQPTTAPVEGTTSTQLNVRAEPSTASEVIGIIAANSKVQIIGKDIGESWWQIAYEAGLDGKGWVTAQYVETGGRPEVPVIGGDDSDPLGGSTAVIIQQLNVRSGPGTSFTSLGILNPNDVISLTGKNNNGSWLQIDFPVGADGKGWVSSGFVKADDTTGLPIVSEAGYVIGTGTPEDTPLPPAPTLVPAPLDFDSADAPVKTVLLGGVGTHTALYNGDVSFPEGDTEDWISITPQENIVFASVKCTGSDSLQIEIIGTGINLACNKAVQAISTSIDKPFLIHIQAQGSEDLLQYTNYILNIKASP